jgi:Domain of unknown function (DUF4389)
MSSYPVTYGASYAEERSRLSTFFRFLTLIPAAIVICVLAIPALVTLPVTWIAIVVSGHYPASLYGYHSGLLRAGARLNAYAGLVTDQYPPMNLSEEPAYPVRVAIGPPQAEYSRLLALVRLILYIPVHFIAYALMIISGLASVGAWFVIVVTGRQMPALQGAINLGHAYQTRAYGYLMLLTDRWPPLDEIEFELEPVADPPNVMTPSSTGALPSEKTSTV